MEKKYIYLVKETQYEDIDCINRTVHVFDNEQEAVKCARTLNIKYGDSCEFTKQGDFVEMIMSNVESCFYEVEKIELETSWQEQPSKKEVESWTNRINNKTVIKGD